MTKRILITGGAGFLGSHLSERLVNEGHDVLCLDNFYTGSKRNVRHLLDKSNFELMRHDVTFPLYVEVDRIYNLACPASPIHYQRDPVQTTKTSVFCRRLRLRSMATLRCIHKRKITGEESILWVFDRAMTKANGVLKHCFLIIGVSINLKSK